MNDTNDEQFDGGIAVIGLSGRFPGAASVVPILGKSSRGSRIDRQVQR